MTVVIKEVEGTNEGGICPVMRVIPTSQVVSFPDVIGGKITQNPTVSGSWSEIELVEDTAFPQEDRIMDGGRTSRRFVMGCNIAQITLPRQQILEKLEREPLLVDITDRNGVRKLVGSKEEGAMLHLKSLSPGKVGHDRNQFDVEILCHRRQRVPYFDPE